MIWGFLRCVVQLEEHIFEGALPLSLVPPDLFCTSHQKFPPFVNFQVASILFFLVLCQQHINISLYDQSGCSSNCQGFQLE